MRDLEIVYWRHLAVGGVFQHTHGLQNQAAGNEVVEDDGKRSANHASHNDDDAVEKELIFVRLIRDIDVITPTTGQVAVSVAGVA